MREFKNIGVVPFTELLDSPLGKADHKGGPIWPAWDQEVEPRFCRNKRPIDVRPDEQPYTAQLREPHAWGGPIINHFGHQLADFSMRILPTIMEQPSIPFIFARTMPEHQRYAKILPPFFAEILAWYDVPLSRVHILPEPTLVKTLLVAPQMEQLTDVPITSPYLEALSEIALRKLDVTDRRGTLFVSRAGQKARFAGEAYLEKVFQSVDIEVIRPEQHSLEYQLKRYASSENLVFSEGSALHGCQLLGKNLGNFLTINRRKGMRVAERVLGARSQSVDYLDAIQQNIHPLHARGFPSTAVGITVLDEDLLLGGLENHGISIKSHWSADAYKQAIAEDVSAWAGAYFAMPKPEHEQSFKYMVDCLKKSGLDWLEPAITSNYTRTTTRVATPVSMIKSKAPTWAKDLVGKLMPSAINRNNAPAVSAPAAKSVTSSGREKDMSTAIPQSWTNRRIERIIATRGSKSYLEIGLFKGDTFKYINVDKKVGVDPSPAFDPKTLISKNVEVHSITSDDYFAQTSVDARFDLIFIDGLHTFEQTYRDFNNAINHSHPWTIFIIDDTVPMDVYASIPNQARSLKARDAAGITVRGWHGDVYKVVYAIHDFHPGFDYRTIIGSGNPQTLVWRSNAGRRTPKYNNFETISRLNYFDLKDNFDIMRPAKEDEALSLCFSAAPKRDGV